MNLNEAVQNCVVRNLAYVKVAANETNINNTYIHAIHSNFWLGYISDLYIDIANLYEN
jgi:hypothetical protein